MKRALLLALTLAGCAGSKPQPPIGTAAAVTLKLWSTGDTYSLAEARGNVIVLDAWATWCAPCVDQLTQLDALSKRWAPRKVRVFAVNVDTDAALVGPFLVAHRVDLPILVDPGGTVLDRVLGLRVMPTTWVFDHTGQLVLAESGAGSVEQVTSQVERMLAAPSNP